MQIARGCKLVSCVVLVIGCGPGAPPAPRGAVAGSKGATAAAAGEGVYVGDLDRKADPCDDFYEFSNGSWRASNPIPATMDRWSRRWQSGERAKEQLKELLDPIALRTDWPAASIEQLTGDFYASCLDQKRADDLGFEPIEPLLAEIAGIRNRAGVQRMIERLHWLDIPMPFAMAAQSDLHEPTRVIAFIAASGLGLPDRDYYVVDKPRFVEARQRYQEHVAAMFQLLGRSPAAARKAAGAVFALETKLARASLDNVALRDPKATDHKMTMAELRKLAPGIDWKRYFEAARVEPAPLNVNQPRFMAELDRQLAKTSIADWKTYFEWHLVNSAADSLSSPFVDEDFAFYGKYLAGRQEMKPRWTRCVEMTDRLLGEALGQKYVEKYFPPEAKARMKHIVDNLLAAMDDTIHQLDWMSEATKKRALEKLATFNPKIGYPDKWKDYSSIPILRDRLWANIESARAWNVNDDRSTIGKPVDRGRWGMTPPTSDAYYSPSLNEIVFPAGILQPPAFRLDAVDAINYGAIGVVIGHEISHGFDDQGAQFDAQGRLDNWWTAADLEQFHARGRCVVSQYDGYFIEEDIHHNGALVLGESIGDLGGVNLAFRAFEKAKREKAQPTLDGFTPDQQFFIAWGQFRSDAIRPETQRLMVQSDPHPIAKYRVIGPLSNTPSFQTAFGCKSSAPMVRAAADRCVVW